MGCAWLGDRCYFWFVNATSIFVVRVVTAILLGPPTGAVWATMSDFSFVVGTLLSKESAYFDEFP